jgi:hypothetical protein
MTLDLHAPSLCNLDFYRHDLCLECEEILDALRPH